MIDSLCIWNTTVSFSGQECCIFYFHKLDDAVPQVSHLITVTKSFKLEIVFLGMLHTLCTTTIKSPLTKKENRLVYIENY